MYKTADSNLDLLFLGMIPENRCLNLLIYSPYLLCYFYPNALHAFETIVITSYDCFWTCIMLQNCRAN